MNITFLVGNGFDIAAGLDTSYRSFLMDFCRTDENDSTTVKRFKEAIKKDKDAWSDLESWLGNFTKKFSPEEFDDFFEGYEYIRKRITEYISKKGNYDKGLITDNVLEDFKDGILNFHQELSPLEFDMVDSLVQRERKLDSTTVNFISFNYTNLLDLYVEELSNKFPTLDEWPLRINCTGKVTVNPKVHHIHGRTGYYTIMGVGSEKYIANPEMLLNSKIRCALLKEESVRAIGEKWYGEASSLINRSKIICIFGMSLGKSDSIWWTKVGEWLAGDKNRQVIIYWYSLEPRNYISPVLYQESIEKIRDKLLENSDVSPERAKAVRDRIHVVINTNKVLAVKKPDINA